MGACRKGGGVCVVKSAVKKKCASALMGRRQRRGERQGGGQEPGAYTEPARAPPHIRTAGFLKVYEELTAMLISKVLPEYGMPAEVAKWTKEVRSRSRGA